MRRFYLLFASLLLCISAFALPQPPVVVNWDVSIDSVSPTEGAVVATATIAEGYHIYGMEKPQNLDIPLTLTSLKVLPQHNVELVGEVSPSREADVHTDMLLNAELQWWDNTVTLRQGFRLINNAKGAKLAVEISYMACNATSCTAPVTDEFTLSFGSSHNASQYTNVEEQIESQPINTSASGNHDSWWAPVDTTINEAVSTSSVGTPWWQLLGMGFLGGLLALLTPCVWPMIPMTVSFFLKTNKSRRKSVMNAITYGLSIVVIFLVLGMAISLIFGAGKLNEIATSAFFNIVFFLILVVFAISFFGAFDIKLPSSWSNAMDNRAESTTGIMSIFFMAFTLVLVSFSCTGPIIGTLLVEAASQSSIIGPLMGMTGFSLGLALPFTLFAIFPSFLNSMPKSGGWLNSVKVVLGFIELILSLKFLSVADLAYGWRILDREVFVAIWIVLFVLLGMYLLGKLRFSHDSEQKHTSVFGFFLAVISFSFAVYLLPGLWGAPLKSISAFAPPLSTQDFNLYGHEYREFYDYDEGMQYAKETGKPVIIDFTGYGCVNCRKMEMAVFDTPDVKKAIEDNYVLIKLFVDEKKELPASYTVEQYGKQKKIKTYGDQWTHLQMHKFGISAQPYYVLLDNDGQPLAPPRDYNENVSEFLDWLNLGNDTYHSQK